MMKYVVAVEPLGGHRLRLRFDDGVEGELDFDAFFEFVGVFKPHRDPAYFAEVKTDGVTLCWPDGTDLDPIVLYSRITGRKPLDVLRERTRNRRSTRSARARHPGRAARAGARRSET